jgi:hypothetical protein
VVPLAKEEPEAGTYVIVAEQLSVAVAAKVTGAAQVAPTVLAVTLAGQVMDGAWLSTTVTRKVQVEVRPEASVAVTVTVVAPKLKVLPEAGL